VELLVQRYSDEPEALAVAAGLESRNPQPSSASTCPVCLGPRPPLTEPAPSLSCMHYCCRVGHTRTHTHTHTQPDLHSLTCSLIGPGVLAGVPDGADRAEPGHDVSLSNHRLPRSAHLQLLPPRPHGRGHRRQGNPRHAAVCRPTRRRPANRSVPRSTRVPCSEASWRAAPT